MDMYRCDICPMSFLTESGVRRHLLCSHGRRFHRGRPSSLVPTELLEAAVPCGTGEQSAATSSAGNSTGTTGEPSSGGRYGAGRHLG